MSEKNININELVSEIGENSDRTLKFYFEGSAINPGYHVTEVRHSQIKSRDCGKKSGVDEWDEVTIQLLDGSSNSKQGHMSGSKFIGILNSALGSLAVSSAQHLFIEFAPGNGPIRKLSIDSVETVEDETSVYLDSERAVCKPFQRAKALAALGGAAASSSEAGCCGDGKRSDGSSCCG